MGGNIRRVRSRPRMPLAKLRYADAMFATLPCGIRCAIEERCLALLTACLNHKGVGAKQLGISHATFERFKAFANPRKVGTLVRV